MDLHLLEEIGLTKTEVKIYLALLKIGESTATPIIREAGIHGAKVYEFLDRLIQKGLVTYVTRANRKNFVAVDPQHLKLFLQERQQQIERQKEKVGQLIPQLHALQVDGGERLKPEIYEGLRGVKSFYEKILGKLKRGQTSQVIGAPRIANEKIEAFLLDWHQRRIKKGVRCQYLYDSDVRDYGAIRAKMKYTQVRYLPNRTSSPIWVEISGNTVGIARIKGNNALIMAIEDADVAKGFLDYFRLLWGISEK